MLSSLDSIVDITKSFFYNLLPLYGIKYDIIIFQYTDVLIFCQHSL